MKPVKMKEEDRLFVQNLSGLVAGVDEAGRGPLAGPVVAAAVILPESFDLPGLTDSKLLSEAQREELYGAITSQARAWAVGRAEVAEIDELNIYWATLLAMKRAVESLSMTPEQVLVDGNRCPDIVVSARAIVKGDLWVDAISAASIIAKHTRDQEMKNMDELYPEYGFASHKGYPTKQHIQALADHGVTDIHRRSYKPVKACLEKV